MACDPKPQNSTQSTTFNSNQQDAAQKSSSDRPVPSYDDLCNSFNRALNGVFSSRYSEGTMTWKGGVKGTVEIAGADYNDMTCTYTVSDCSLGTVNMICDNSAYDTQILLFSPDSIKVGDAPYTRVK